MRFSVRLGTVLRSDKSEPTLGATVNWLAGSGAEIMQQSVPVAGAVGIEGS
ncbi:MAG: hypothetical protein LAO21_12945 [Acidobacteriia bacterium]|nr:hypothetical protein [Terriglobia bacterium]